VRLELLGDLPLVRLQRDERLVAGDAEDARRRRARYDETRVVSAEAIRRVLPRCVLGPLEPEHERLERPAKIVADFYLCSNLNFTARCFLHAIDATPARPRRRREMT
jgi:hypothetical protein